MTSARSASSARRSAGERSAVSSSVGSPTPENSGQSGSRSSRPLTTAIGGVGRWPRASRCAAYSGRGSSGPYFSARAVPAPTRITSERERSMANTSLSPGDDSVPDRPFQPWAAPSRLVIMLDRTHGMSGGYSYAATKSSGRSCPGVGKMRCTGESHQTRSLARMPARLVDRRPEVSAETLIAELVPPPRFDGVRFETYVPDFAQPTQAAAVATVRAFAGRPPDGRRGWLRRRGAPSEDRPGLYLDGGF